MGTLAGQRVSVFPLISCNRCTLCQKKQYEMCRQYSYLGSRRDGEFVKYAAVLTENLVKLLDHVSFMEDVMMGPMAVAVHAMRRIAADWSLSTIPGTIGIKC